MIYTKEQIDRANEVDLGEFLTRQGETLRKSGSELEWEAHDSFYVMTKTHLIDLHAKL